MVRWLLAVTGVVIVTSAAPATAQPPVDRSVYDIIDVGPVEPPSSCECLARPFALSSFRPDPGHFGSGPGIPLGPATPTKEEVARHRRESAKERRQIQQTMRNARAGNLYDSFALGVAYTTGTGVPQNQAAAAAWYALAARQGHEQAATLLGSRYLRGIGVPQDDATAAYWFRLGAEGGDRQALTALGLMYAAGRGVPQDLGIAIRLWTQAGDGAALRLLGDAYACGFGVELNPAHAVALYRRAPEFSGVELGQMYRSACGVALDDEAAVKWFRGEADQGNPEAQVALSEMFERGAGVGASPFEAYQWAALAAYRLPAGELRDRALTLRDQAAQSLGAQDVEAAETTIRALMESHVRQPEIVPTPAAKAAR